LELGWDETAKGAKTIRDVARSSHVRLHLGQLSPLEMKRQPAITKLLARSKAAATKRLKYLLNKTKPGQLKEPQIMSKYLMLRLLLVASP
jgi:hypothetical protein